MKRLQSVLSACFALLLWYPGGASLADTESLEPAEAETLSYLREFAKYKWDVYRGSGDVWNESVFIVLALDEQHHMDTLKTLLDHYGVEDPVVSYEYWAYSEGFLTEDLHNRMFVGWMLPPAHLRNGAYLEEMNIRDLRQAIEETDESLLTDSYAALLADSYVHLVVFAGHLYDDPAHYSAQLLSQEDVDKIIAETQVAPTDYDFEINPGLNDSWYDPATPGQGFFISVFPQTKTVMLSWLTFDTELPAQNASANLGDPGQRWLTGQGSYEGSRAELVVYSSSGGLFQDSLAVPVLEPVGSISLQFGGCDNGGVSYDLPGILSSGLIQIRRVASDNVALCEAQAHPVP